MGQLVRLGDQRVGALVQQHGPDLLAECTGNGSQVALFGAERKVATLLNYTRYDKIVEAMGGHGEHVTEPDGIRPALERAFASGKPALVNVEMRRDVDTGMKGSTYV